MLNISLELSAYFKGVISPQVNAFHENKP